MRTAVASHLRNTIHRPLRATPSTNRDHRYDFMAYPTITALNLVRFIDFTKWYSVGTEIIQNLYDGPETLLSDARYDWHIWWDAAETYYYDQWWAMIRIRKPISTMKLNGGQSQQAFQPLNSNLVDTTKPSWWGVNISKLTYFARYHTDNQQFFVNRNLRTKKPSNHLSWTRSMGPFFTLQYLLLTSNAQCSRTIWSSGVKGRSCIFSAELCTQECLAVSRYKNMK